MSSIKQQKANNVQSTKINKNSTIINNNLF